MRLNGCTGVPIHVRRWLRSRGIARASVIDRGFEFLHRLGMDRLPFRLRRKRRFRLRFGSRQRGDVEQLDHMGHIDRLRRLKGLAVFGPALQTGRHRRLSQFLQLRQRRFGAEHTVVVVRPMRGFDAIDCVFEREEMHPQFGVRDRRMLPENLPVQVHSRDVIDRAAKLARIGPGGFDRAQEHGVVIDRDDRLALLARTVKSHPQRVLQGRRIERRFACIFHTTGEALKAPPGVTHRYPAQSGPKFNARRADLRASCPSAQIACAPLFEQAWPISGAKGGGSEIFQ